MRVGSVVALDETADREFGHPRVSGCGHLTPPPSPSQSPGTR
jgi:hypothetical protein